MQMYTLRTPNDAPVKNLAIHILDHNNIHIVHHDDLSTTSCRLIVIVHVIRVQIL